MSAPSPLPPPFPLVKSFLRQSAVPLDWPADAALESALRALVDTGRAAWPDLDVPDEAFVEHLGEHLTQEDAGAGPAAYGRTLAIGDLYLSCSILLGLAGAVEAFERLHVSRVPALVAHMNQSPSFIAELQQDLRERVLVGGRETPPRIAQYSGRGSLSGWFSSVTVRAALNRLRATTPLPLEDDRAVAVLVSDLDPERDILRTRYGAAFEQALTDAVGALDAQQRNVLHLYHAGGLTVTQLAGMFQVHHSTVVRWLTAARATIARETRRLLGERLHVESSEFSEIRRAMMSALDISLSGLLRRPNR